MKLVGKCSWFGGPADLAQGGIAPDEGLAFIEEIWDAPDLFLSQQPPGSTGLAARLNPEKFYLATRWDYSIISKDELLKIRCIVRAPKTGKRAVCRPADWGPHEEKTGGRVADLSPGLMEYLFGTLDATDEEVEVFIPVADEDRMTTVAISAGHSDIVRGASGYIDEVEQAQRLVPAIAERLRRNGCEVVEIIDHTSTTQQQNLEWLTDEHNAVSRDVDLSIHFNSSDGMTDEPIGCEVLYVSQSDLAAQLSAAIADAGELKDRGPKYRDGLYWLNNTTAPACLLEVAFCNSRADSDFYLEGFQDIANAIADVIQPPPAVVSARRK